MATLTNTKIKDTYKALLKVSDNGNLEAGLQEITDGEGNASGVQLNTGGDLTASGTVAFGSLKDSGENITITKFVDEADSIAANDNDTTIPTSAAVKDYVDTKVTAEDLDFAGDSGTGSVDLDSQTFTISGTANEIETSASGQTITIGLPSSVTVGTLTATNLAGTLSTAAQTNITSVGTLSSLAVSGNLTVDTNTLFVDASANTVSIGTTLNNSELTLSSNAAGNDYDANKIRLFDGNDGGATIYGFGVTGGKLNYRTGTSADQHIWWAGTTERMRIDSSGRVGIGTSSPKNTAHINGSLQIGFVDASNDAMVLSWGGASTNGSIQTFSSSVLALNPAGNNVCVGTSSASQKLTVNGNVAVGGQQSFWFRDDDGFSSSAARRAWAIAANLDTFGTLSFKVGTAAGSDPTAGTTAMSLNSSGNMVFPNGQGIDFSASAGGGATSSLLDDYEEGTWTPVYVPATGSFTTMTMSILTAKYTKIGNMVTVFAWIRTNGVDLTGGTGAVRLSGLPFTVSGTGGGIAVGAANDFSTLPSGGYIQDSSTYISLRKTNGTEDLGVSDLDTVAGLKNSLLFTANYMTS